MLNNTDESNLQDTNYENYNLGLVEFSIHNNTDRPNVPKQTPCKKPSRCRTARPDKWKINKNK